MCLDLGVSVILTQKLLPYTLKTSHFKIPNFNTMKFIKGIFFFLLSLFLFGIVIEGILGIAFYIKDKYIDHVEIMEVQDYPYLYYLFKPGENLNEHGFKTRYLPTKSNADSYRILLLGGSVARGYEADSTIAVFLEQRLENQYPNKDFEVVNAGVSSFLLQQEFILLQTIGMDYLPDMVIGIDGYNDIATQWYNRFYDSTHPLPPHSWGDFRVIRDNSFKNKPYSRFAYFFKNIDRVKKFLLRKKIDSNLSCESEDTEIQLFEKAYQKLTLDTKAYCEGYEIPYLQFIQPLKFFSSNSEYENLDCRQKKYFQRYQSLLNLSEELDFVYPLNSVIPVQDYWWKDECHVINKGNILIANKISNQLLKDSLITSLNHYE